MFKKPELPYAKAVHKYSREELRKDMPGMPEDVIEYLYKTGMAESENRMGIGGEYEILGVDTEHKFKALKTKGCSTTLSMHRLTSGCNNLHQFRSGEIEKSEDYDDIPPEKFVDLPTDHNDALRLALQRYKGKTLRIVARTITNVSRFDTPYYLFAVE